MNCSVEYTRPETIDWLAGRLRRSDIDEIKAASGRSPNEALQTSFKHSNLCWTLVGDNEPVGVFGCAASSFLGSVGVPWMLGTEKLNRVRKDFIKQSEFFVYQMRERYDVLENWIHVNQHKSIKWLEWLGFKLDEPMKFGINKELFIRFHIENYLYV